MVYSNYEQGGVNYVFRTTPIIIPENGSSFNKVTQLIEQHQSTENQNNIEPVTKKAKLINDSKSNYIKFDPLPFFKHLKKCLELSRADRNDYIENEVVKDLAVRTFKDYRAASSSIFRRFKTKNIFIKFIYKNKLPEEVFKSRFVPGKFRSVVEEADIRGNKSNLACVLKMFSTEKGLKFINSLPNNLYLDN